jgi:hypothetical protein
VALDAGNLPAIVKKLTELNADTGSAALTSEELHSLQLAAETVAATSRYHATSIFPAQMSALGRALKWPPAQRFPGPWSPSLCCASAAHDHGAWDTAADLLRLAVLHPSVAEAYEGEPRRLLSLIVDGTQLDAAALRDVPVGNSADVNRMMGLRALANLACTRIGRAVLTACLPQVRAAPGVEGESLAHDRYGLVAGLQVVALVQAVPTASSSKPYHLALATLHLKCVAAVSAHRGPLAHLRVGARRVRS